MKKDIIILTALPSEFSALESVFKTNGARWEGRASDGVVNLAVTGSIRELSIAAACCPTMGNISAAGTTARMLAQFRPALAILVGLGAVMNFEKYRLGDVVVADGLKSRQFQKISTRGFNACASGH